MRLVRILAAVAVVAISAAAFQNCDRGYEAKNEPAKTQMSGNGWSYDGKVFNSAASCSESELPQAKIKVVNEQTALLTKENCQILAVPQPIPKAEWSLHPDRADELVYNARPFHTELPIQRPPIEFIESSSAVSTVAASAASSAPFAGPTLSGDLLICTVLYNSPNGSAEITGMTDNLGNLFRRAVGPLSAARPDFGGYTAEVWYVENALPGVGQRATATFSESIPANQFTWCYQYRGLVAANALDQVASAAVHSPGTPATLQLAPVSTHFNRELIFVAHFGSVLPLGGAFVPRNGGGVVDGASDQVVNQTVTIQLNLPTDGSAAAAILTFKAE